MKERMTFNSDGGIEDWDLSELGITELPGSMGGLHLSGDL